MAGFTSRELKELDGSIIDAPRSGSSSRVSAKGAKRIKRAQQKLAAKQDKVDAEKASRAKARAAMSGIKTRQSTKGNEVVSSTDLTKRGPVNPETGNRERLFS